MRNGKYKIRQFFFYSLLATLCSLLFLSCGYHIVGSQFLPFSSITIKQVRNRTYEPKLEEKLHNAFSKEFIALGIKVKAVNGDIELESTVTAFELRSIAAIEEKVQELAITMKVDVKITDNGRVTEFASMQSPIQITFQSTGSVIESVVQKERAINKACSEIAKEVISKIIIQYAK